MHLIPNPLSPHLNDDQAQRQQALDPQQSFIVQAPAGSGKTELLIQRFLKLLAHVKEPEQVWAITFTRKAASEMRFRILQALQTAKHRASVEHPTHTITASLASDVLDKDRQQQWHVLRSSHRLNIMTIDALYLKWLGHGVRITQQPVVYYQKAIQTLITSIDDYPQWRPSLERLLLYLDNHQVQFERLCIDLLAQREQWLPSIHLKKGPLRQQLENTLQRIVQDHLSNFYDQCTEEQRSSLCLLLRFAQQHLEPSSTLQLDASSWEYFPQPDINQLPAFLQLADFLLTQKDTWRQQVTTKIGFPSPCSSASSEEKAYYTHHKKQMKALLSDLEANQKLLDSLIALRHSPHTHYTEQQWAVIEDLLELLPVLVAHLHLHFQEDEVIDFIELSHAAQRKLGNSDTPSDLALALDHQIQHLLVDEFQDTSITQFHMLERITENWEPHDHKTLFLVGDPMQSIYRFRQAEVGLFLQTQMHGIGPVHLTSLHLKQNFRSTPSLLKHINTVFEQVFPKTSSIAAGAITYNTSSSGQMNVPDDIATPWSAHLYAQRDQMIQAMVHNITQHQTNHPTDSIAILVAARSHLTGILPALRAHHIDYQATEIDSLKSCSAVQDLLALTRALLHPADHIAWLAVLRAPWCGLTLHDLYHLRQHAIDKPLWHVLANIPPELPMSQEGRQRLACMVPHLAHALQQRHRQALKPWIYDTWMAINGPQCLENSIDLGHVHTFFQDLQHIAMPLEGESLTQRLEHLYGSQAAQTDNPVQIMTIHKAKGLAFDVVVIPGLNQRQARREQRWLHTAEYVHSTGQAAWLLAPTLSTDQEHTATYRYIMKLNQKKSDYEHIRLLYVAATRARKQIYLLACQNEKNNVNQSFKPSYGASLSYLWPALKTTLHQHPIDTPFHTQPPSPNFTLLTRMLHQTPTTTEKILQTLNPPTQSQTTLYSIKQAIGIVIHHYLTWAGDGFITLKKDNISEPHIKELLEQYGVTNEKMSQASAWVKQMLIAIADDPKAQWILQPHDDARNEYPITYLLDNQPIHYKVDRTFIENEVRWIIDYKTGLFKPEKHREQLHHYALAFQTLDNYNVKTTQLGLYFIRTQQWYSWTADGKGYDEGRLKEKRWLAQSMLKKAFDLKTIHQLTQLSQAELNKLQQELEEE